MTDLTPDQLPDGWSAGATGYDEFFAPHTRLWAEDVVTLTGVGDGTRFLDVAAGSGALTLAAARRGAAVTAIDFAPGMVEQLRSNLTAQGLSGSVHEMDGQALDFAEDSFDVAASLFGLIFFPDQAKGLSELRRVLRPGGRVAIAAWEVATFPLYQLMGRIMATLRPDAPPAPGPPAFARLGAADPLEAAVAGAGFGSVEVHAVTHPMVMADPGAFFLHMPAWAPPAKLLIGSLTDDELTEAVAIWNAGYEELAGGQDGVPATALVAVATVPA